MVFSSIDELNEARHNIYFAKLTMIDETEEMLNQLRKRQYLAHKTSRLKCLTNKERLDLINHYIDFSMSSLCVVIAVVKCGDRYYKCFDNDGESKLMSFEESHLHNLTPVSSYGLSGDSISYYELEDGGGYVFFPSEEYAEKFKIAFITYCNQIGQNITFVNR